MSNASAEVPTIRLTVRATRPIPSMGFATGEVRDLVLEARFPSDTKWRELVRLFATGALEDVSDPPITNETIKEFIEGAVFGGAQ